MVSTIASTPTHDDRGFVAGFADGTGRYLPLVCTLNAARVLDAAAGMLRVDHDELSRLALSAPAGSEGLVLVPYLEGERTPNRPNATGALHGLRVSNSTAANLARAAVEGLLCALADGIDHLTTLGVVARRVLAHRRRRSIAGLARNGADGLRRPGAGAPPGGIRGARGGAAGRLGARRRPASAAVDPAAGRRVRRAAVPRGA